MSHAFKEALWKQVFLSSLQLPVPCPFSILSDNQVACTLSLSPLILNILTFVIISFRLMFKMVLLKPFGYQLLICLQICSQNHLILFYFLVIEKFLAFLSLYLRILFIFSFHSDGGVLTIYIYSQNVSHHMTILCSLYTHTTFHIPQLSLFLSNTEEHALSCLDITFYNP